MSTTKRPGAEKSASPDPDDQAMAWRLAAAVGEQSSTCSSSAAIMAAGSFAIAASIDRLVQFVREKLVEEEAERRLAEEVARKVSAP